MAAELSETMAQQLEQEEEELEILETREDASESPEAKARGVRREIGGATGERASVRGSQGGHVGPRADPASGRTHLK